MMYATDELGYEGDSSDTTDEEDEVSDEDSGEDDSSDESEEDEERFVLNQLASALVKHNRSHKE